MNKTIELENLSQDQIRDLLPEGLILLCYRGSIAHNMYVPKSDPQSIDDKDIMGAYVAPIEHYIGFKITDTKEKFINEWDAVSYEVRKLIRLLLKSNPNVLSMLWVPERHIIYQHELGLYLRENKEIFVTKEAYHSFTGYAYGQFKRMTHFNQDAQREMAEFEQIISEHEIDLNKLNPSQNQRNILLKDGIRLGEVIDKYKGLKKKYYSSGYMGEKRKKLVKKFGYDAKNAAHLIRLLRMGIEFLKDGELHVERTDAEELLSIKQGDWTLEKIKEEAERLFKLSEEAYIQSKLPLKPDEKKAESVCMKIISQYHNTN
ncbi:MAG: nucleotidyltransferase domain-containing protein [Desulfobacterales bacterium]|nr:nucleotidyltransferase domain-containing protein [Desulfobacterales bacterium]